MFVNALKYKKAQFVNWNGCSLTISSIIWFEFNLTLMFSPFNWTILNRFKVNFCKFNTNAFILSYESNPNAEYKLL